MKIGGAPTIGLSAHLFPSQLKRKLLLFDKVAVPKLEATIGIIRFYGQALRKQDEYNALADDLEFLADKKLVFDVDYAHPKFMKLTNALDSTIITDQAKELIRKQIDEILPGDDIFLINEMLRADQKSKKEFRRLLNTVSKYGEIDFETRIGKECYSSSVETHSEFLQIYARLFVGQWNFFENEKIVPLNSYTNALPSSLSTEHASRKADVIEVVLNKIPLPSDAVSWEEILEYREEERSRGYLAGLRVWTSEAMTGSMSAQELDQKLEWLLFERKQYLAASKMSVENTAIGSLFVNSLEAVENLVKFKWGKAAKAVLALQNRKADLLKVESEGPHKQLNYIIRTETQFTEV